MYFEFIIQFDISGRFIQYNTAFDQGGPIIEGFKAGSYLDNSDVFVGYANNAECNGEIRSPARIRAIPPAGGYVSRCGTEGYDSSTAFYLQNHPNLAWVSATTSTVLQVPNVFVIDGGNSWIFAFARINATYQNQPYTTIGKILRQYNPDPSLVPTVWWYDRIK